MSSDASDTSPARCSPNSCVKIEYLTSRDDQHVVITRYTPI